ncbi:sulfite exporter TauE/SafE family protein [Halobacteriovorax sp.]|uniref:sulfite exporter TauE/SafE family protein n=1 Tax=Halobacteriovorax sp. TaxID=2020862 RepID=UPI0035620160
MTYLIYLLLGVFAGTLSGLFGIGGGLVIVPTLLFCFRFLGFSPDLAIHMAIGTSLSIIVITSSNSVFSHHKRGGIDWKIVRKILIPLIIGTYSGGLISSKLSASLLETIFSVYVVLVSLKMFLDVKIDKIEKETSIIMYSIVGAIIGFKSAILGIGGGTISIPFLSWRGFSMKKAVGVSAALGLPISIVGSISYIVSGLKVTNLPEQSLGYIYLPAFLGVILTSSFFAHLGAKLSHKLPQDKMRKGFAIFLSIIAVKMIFFS